METIHVKIRGPNSTINLSLCVGSTFKELIEKIKVNLSIHLPFDLMVGFPPVVCKQLDSDLVSGFLKNNENIRVQLRELVGVQVQGTAEVKKSTKRKQPAKTTTPTSLSFGAKVSTLKKTDSSSSSFLVKSPNSSNNESSVPKAKRQKRMPKSTAGSEHDIADHLISAVSGGKGTRNTVLRKVFRNAVELQYNSSKAVARLNAAYSGNYTIKEVSTSRVLGSGASTLMEVTFHKGVGNRGFYTETVDLLSDMLLKSVILLALEDTESGSGREVLKPMNLSKCSPRIFWSLVHKYGPNLIESIKEQLKGVDDDCSWLDDRKKELSEKARHNLQQKEELEAEKKERKSARDAKKNKKNSIATGSSGGTDISDPFASGEVNGKLSAEAQEEHSKVKVSQLPLELIAKLNTINLSEIVPVAWLEVVTVYLSNGKESGSSNSGSNNSSGENSESGSSNTSSAIVMRLSSMLVDSPVATVRNRLVDLSLAGQNSTSSSNSSGTSAATAAANSSSTTAEPIKYARILSLNQVEAWVSAAQHSVMSVFWCHVVCGRGCERLRYALQKLRIRTVPELKIWRNGLQGLVDGLIRKDDRLKTLSLRWITDNNSTNSNGFGGGVVVSVLTADTLASVCDVADTLCAELRWVTQYTPNDDSDSAAAEEEEQEEDQAAEGDEEEWLYDASAHQYIAQTVYVLVSDSEYWEIGQIIAHLPATEEEPMALWKAKLDTAYLKKPFATTSSSSVALDGDESAEEGVSFQDLEEHEVEEALARVASMTVTSV